MTINIPERTTGLDEDFNSPEYSDTGLFGIGKVFKKIGRAVGRAAKSVGKGVASAARGVATVATAPIKLASKIPVIGGAIGAVGKIVTAPIDLTTAIVSGQRIDKAVLGNLKGQLGAVKELAPYIATVVSVVPGVGTGVAAGIGAGLALASGKTLSQALVEGIKGGLPGGPLVQSAFSVVEAAASGKPIDQIAISALPISTQAKAAMVSAAVAVKAIAAGQRVDTTLVDAALAQVPTEYRKATQVAIAVAQGKRIQAGQVLSIAGQAVAPGLKRIASSAVSSTAKQVIPMAPFRGLRPPTSIALQRRVGDVLNVLPAPARRAPLQIVNSAQQTIRGTLANSPHLRALPTSQLARRLGMHPSQVAAVLRRGGLPTLPFQGISGNAAKFIRSYSRYCPPNALISDVRGLIDNGKVYVVESGDYPGKIAQKLTGNAGNWPQLIRANPKKATINKGIGPEFKSLYAGEKLLLPASWIKSVPTVPINAADSATVIQAKAILAAWGKTDGKSMAGVTNYGTTPEDLSSGWTARDGLMLKSFSQWSNLSRKTSLGSDGDLTPSHSAALRAWAEERASSSAPTVPTVGPVGTPTIPGLPGMPVVLTPQPAPAALPGLGTTPILPSVPGGTGIVVASPGWPAITSGGSLTPTPAPSSGSAGSSEGKGSLATVLAGAGLGYTVGGPLGALIGGLGGAMFAPKGNA